jgi:hypothetical protein
MIIRLENPLTENYKKVKEYILGDKFSWYWVGVSTPDINIDGYCNYGFFSHALLKRPGEEGIFYSKPTSEYVNDIQAVFMEIANVHNINFQVIHRMNVNCMIPSSNRKYGNPHLDHHFPHKNCLIYLTNSGGNVRVFGDNEVVDYSPEEDDIILFEGKHCPQPPKEDRRVCIVVTYS